MTYMAARNPVAAYQATAKIRASRLNGKCIMTSPPVLPGDHFAERFDKVPNL